MYVYDNCRFYAAVCGCVPVFLLLLFVCLTVSSLVIRAVSACFVCVSDLYVCERHLQFHFGFCFVCDVNVGFTNYSARTRCQQRTYYDAAWHIFFLGTYYIHCLLPPAQKSSLTNTTKHSKRNFVVKEEDSC